jgi:hypothetical protein
MNYRQILMLAHSLLWAFCKVLFGAVFAAERGMPVWLIGLLGAALTVTIIALELRYQKTGKRWLINDDADTDTDTDTKTEISEGEAKPKLSSSLDLGNLIFRTLLTVQEVRGAKSFFDAETLSPVLKLTYLIGLIALGVVMGMLWEVSIRQAGSKNTLAE